MTNFANHQGSTQTAEKPLQGCTAHTTKNKEKSKVVECAGGLSNTGNSHGCRLICHASSKLKKKPRPGRNWCRLRAIFGLSAEFWIGKSAIDSGRRRKKNSQLDGAHYSRGFSWGWRGAILRWREYKPRKSRAAMSHQRFSN